MKKLLLILLLFPSLAFAAAGDNFHPCQTVTLSATTSSSSYALGACGASTLNIDCYNAGSVPVFMTGGVGAATATVPSGTAAGNNYHIGAGLDKVFDLGSADHIAVITSSSTATVYCTSGGGQ